MTWAWLLLLGRLIVNPDGSTVTVIESKPWMVNTPRNCGTPGASCLSPVGKLLREGCQLQGDEWWCPDPPYTPTPPP